MNQNLTVEERIALLITLIALGLILFWCVPKARGVSRGDGAAAIMKGAGLSRSLASLEPPKAIVLPARVYYFAATAIDTDSLESDFSNELAFTNATRARYVVLGWDESISTNIVDYKIYWGRASATYTNTRSVGTNLTCVLPLFRVNPNTNRVVSVSSLSNLSYSVSLGGPLVATTVTNYCVTNPIGNRFWRAGSRVYIQQTWQP